MNIKINGNICTIKSNIDFDTLKKAGPIFVYQDKQKVYGATIGNKGSISTMGITFSYADSEGKACLNLLAYDELPEGDVKEHLLDDIGAELATFKNFEETLKGVLEDVKSDRAAIAEMIQID